MKLLHLMQSEVRSKDIKKKFFLAKLLKFLAVITLYLTQKLNYDNDTATIIFHSFSALTFFACVFSAIISDGWLGNFRTILCSLALYFLGVGLLSIGSVSALPIPEL